MKNHKPIHFLILKIIGFALLAVGVFILVNGLRTQVPDMGEDNWFDSSRDKSFTIFGGIACCFISLPFLLLGFRPEIAKMKVKSAKYIQQANKEDLTDIVSDTADIAGDAVTKTTRAIKKGLADTMYCKHCGAEIDRDSKFCSVCGQAQ